MYSARRRSSGSARHVLCIELLDGQRATSATILALFRTSGFPPAARLPPHLNTREVRLARNRTIDSPLRMCVAVPCKEWDDVFALRFGAAVASTTAEPDRSSIRESLNLLLTMRTALFSPMRRKRLDSTGFRRGPSSYALHVLLMSGRAILTSTVWESSRTRPPRK